jgi:cytoskeleton protein RodZ
MESTGAKLSKARQARGYSVEEAGLQTRIRPSQIAALEADDYSTFGSNTYARGFLMIYGRFLGVDVSNAANQLDAVTSISVDEYQYLNATPEKEPHRPSRSEYAKSERRRPSLIPLVVFIFMLVVGGLGAHFFIQTQRLDSPSPSPQPGAPAISEGPAPATEPNSGVSRVEPVAPTPVPVSATPAPAVPLANPDRQFITPAATPIPFAPPVAATPAPMLAPAPTAPPVPAAAPAAASTPAPLNELTVEPLKKTWVRIRRNDPAAEPVFEDIVYPKVGALKIMGTRFWIEVRDADAISVRRNGQIVACQPPGVEIP